MELQYDNCPHCFAKLNGVSVCPECGFDKEQIKMNPNVLPPFTMLKNRYLLGHVLGQGGFGVTYVALDLGSGGKRCAIKEYMPVEYARRRSDGIYVTLNESGNSKVYEHGKKRFIEEAQTLYNLKANPTVVQICGFFEENNTGYLVMEFLDGVNLRGYMRQHGGRVETQLAKKILATIASSMIEIHKKNILHRDISPENIFLTRDGNIKLIDFGSARNYISAQKANGLSVLLKPGFAPPEQYSSQGSQGPWTDVYSLAATFYYVVSGNKLIDATYRMRGQKQETLLELGCDVTTKTSHAINKAMEPDIRKRYKDFAEFLADIDIDYIQPKADSTYKKSYIQPKEDAMPPKQKTVMSGQSVVTQQTSVGVTKKQGGYSDKKPKKKNQIVEIDDGTAGQAKKLSFFRRSIQVPVVRIISGSRAGRKIEIPKDEIVKIGRSDKQNHLVIDGDSDVSRIHCAVKYSCKKKKFFICDFSSNGTYLENGTRLDKNKSYSLLPGTQFYLSSRRNMLKVELEER